MILAGGFTALFILSVVLLIAAWVSSGRAAPRPAPIRIVDGPAKWVNRDEPHTSSTCAQSGWDMRLGF